MVRQGKGEINRSVHACFTINLVSLYRYTKIRQSYSLFVIMRQTTECLIVALSINAVLGQSFRAQLPLQDRPSQAGRHLILKQWRLLSS